MKKVFLFLLAGMFAAGSYADTDITLSVKSVDGGAVNFNIADIQNITFAGNMMVVKTLEGEERLDIDSIDDMVFDIVSGIEAVYENDSADGLFLKVEKGVLAASESDTMLNLRIFDMGGRLVDMASAMSEISYDLSHLAKGTYIVTVNDKAIKFIR